MRPIQAKWANSESSYNLVVEQIKERWGEEQLKLHNPKHSCHTFQKWLKHGYSIKKGEKAIKTYSVADIVNESEQTIATISIPVNLFHRMQVIKIKKKK